MNIVNHKYQQLQKWTDKEKKRKDSERKGQNTKG